MAEKEGYASLAFPIIGSGAGSFSQEKALGFMVDELAGMETKVMVVIVQFGG